MYREERTARKIIKWRRINCGSFVRTIKKWKCNLINPFGTTAVEGSDCTSNEMKTSSRWMGEKDAQPSLPCGVGGTAPDGPAQLKRIWLEHSCVVRCDYVLSVDIKGRSNVIQSDIVFELHPFDVRCGCLAVKLFYFLWELFFWFPR